MEGRIRKEEDGGGRWTLTQSYLSALVCRIIKDKSLASQPVYKTEVSESSPRVFPGSLHRLVIHQAGLEADKDLRDE